MCFTYFNKSVTLVTLAGAAGALNKNIKLELS